MELPEGSRGVDVEDAEGLPWAVPQGHEPVFAQTSQTALTRLFKSHMFTPVIPFLCNLKET